MHVRTLLLATVCVLTPLVAPAQESPDWVFHLYRPYMDHLCWIGDYTPEDLELPWEDVAWGHFEFQFIREGGFSSNSPVRCTVSFGGQEVEKYTTVSECPDEPKCPSHGLSFEGAFIVLHPVSAQDFTVTINSADCGSACGSIGCSPAGELFGTLSLYAESTAAPRDSWSAIKSRY